MKFYKFIVIGLVFIIIFLSLYKTLTAETIAIERPNLTQVARNNEFNRIGSCESHGDLHAKSKTSSASGEYQFINASWYHYGKELWGEEFYSKNIWTEDNRELAWYVYTKYGTKDWNESKSCWG